MTTLTQAKILCKKAHNTSGILTPTETLMLVDWVETTIKDQEETKLENPSYAAYKRNAPNPNSRDYVD